jgi:hypothetical protein
LRNYVSRAQANDRALIGDQSTSAPYQLATSLQTDAIEIIIQ